MRTATALLVLLCMAAPGRAQENAKWEIMPALTFIKYFPGEYINKRNDVYLPTFPPMYVDGWTRINYEGAGLHFSARCLSEEIKPMSLTFGGGVNWFYRPGGAYYSVGSPVAHGIGETIGMGDFMTFPVSIGAQAIFPFENRSNLMFFAGGEFNLQFISGNIDIHRQAQVGYTVLGGFAVKVFEFGIRYVAFSDIRNLGVHFGLRLNSFGI